MKKFFLLVAISIAMVSNAQQEAAYVANEVIVQLQKDSTPAMLAAETTTVTILQSKLLSRPLNIWLLQLSSSQMTEGMAIADLYQNSNVLIAQKNHKISTRAT